MKWQQRVRVATGLSCWQIMLHLLVVAVLVMGWMSGALVRVGLGLCVLYSVTLLAMLFLQRHHEARWQARRWSRCWRKIRAVTLKRSGYNKAATQRIPRSIDNYATGVSKESQRRCSLNDDGYYAIFLRNIAYAAEPVVAAMTSSGHKLPHTISRLASFR